MSRTAAAATAVVGALLVVAGVALFALANSADFGWTTYTGGYEPLEPGAYESELELTFSDGSVLWDRQHAIGAGIAVAGLLLLAVLGGWLLGRRTTRPGTPET
jgi:drug/metabolite transporter (DMT)-like permease